MELSHLILEALNLMFIGMLFVGVFLGILVFLIPLLNKIVPDDPPPTTPPIATGSVAETTTGDQGTLVAVIAAAVQQYRKGR